MKLSALRKKLFVQKVVVEAHDCILFNKYATTFCKMLIIENISKIVFCTTP